MPETWAHLHLPRLLSGVADVISVKVPGQRIAYTSTVTLSGCTFRVSEQGRQRCIRDGIRNVHAWVVGTEGVRVSGLAPQGRPEGFRQALYDPWKGSTFVDADTLKPVLSARYVVMSGKNVYYKES
ncbi:MAG TPA: hypothetical protein VJQ57_13635 [Acidimicrobiia bacterium]|nr:hypothetical protein [Acidimicrobiia bacterium]